MGIVAVQGGASAADLTSKPAKGWETSLNPGDAISGVLVSGDMSATGMGTVTYNDGKRVLAFGHPFFNLGPLDMPMAKSEILMVLSSAYQPTKFGNATEVVGALHQDRFAESWASLVRKRRRFRCTSRFARSVMDEIAGQRERLQLQRVRASEVDPVPDDADAAPIRCSR